MKVNNAFHVTGCGWYIGGACTCPPVPLPDPQPAREVTLEEMLAAIRAAGWSVHNDYKQDGRVRVVRVYNHEGG